MLIIAGGGPDADRLRQVATDRGLQTVEFLGELAPEQLREQFRRVRFSVLPSECAENRPLAVLESLACGLPVVATDVGGLSEIIIPDETGVLVPPNDPAALLAGIERVSDWSSEHRLAARRWTEKNLEPERQIEALVTIFRSLAPPTARA